ncbi:hypothetical protein [Streptomyces sp. NPDC006368]|uniref:hypothetical protein n=1 Tax=Streptomyces sp. NPDC006368 TaxID=3156760 RepID=UPI0033B40E0D
MFRFIRTTTLAALKADLDVARRERDQARTEAEMATDSAIRAENVAEQQLCQLSQAHADRIQDARDAARADRVYALFHCGVLHSVHATIDAAEAAAEAQGAPRSGWTTLRPGAAIPSAADVAWRVQALPLGGIE